MGGSAQSLLLQHQLMMQQQQQQQQQPQQQQQVQQQQLSQQQQFIMGQVLAAEQAVPPIRYQPRTFVEGDFDFVSAILRVSAPVDILELNHINCGTSQVIK